MIPSRRSTKVTCGESTLSEQPATRADCFYSIKLPGIFLTLVLFFHCCTSRQDRESDIPLSVIESAEQNLNDENWDTRKKAVAELSDYMAGRYKERVESDMLRDSRDSHDEIRIEVIHVFMKQPSPLFRQRLVEMTDDPGANVRWYALQSLGAYGDPEAAPVFINGLSSDDWLIREASITGLLKIKDPSLQEEIIPHIILALQDENQSVRIAALENLTIKDQRLYPVIASLLITGKQKGPTILIPVLNALRGYMLERDARDIVIGMLTHPSSEIRMASFRVLREDQALRDKKKRKTD